MRSIYVLCSDRFTLIKHFDGFATNWEKKSKCKSCKHPQEMLANQIMHIRIVCPGNK